MLHVVVMAYMYLYAVPQWFPTKVGTYVYRFWGMTELSENRSSSGTGSLPA